jgi:hypothetical protein
MLGVSVGSGRIRSTHLGLQAFKLNTTPLEESRTNPLQLVVRYSNLGNSQAAGLTFQVGRRLPLVWNMI